MKHDSGGSQIASIKRSLFSPTMMTSKSSFSLRLGESCILPSVVSCPWNA